MKIKIKNRWDNNSVICSFDAINLKEGVLEAIKNRINLSWADLSRADLSRANLSEANLSGANLSGANLSGIRINKKELIILINQRLIVPEGDLIVYKKLQSQKIITLLIPKDAKRVGGLIGRKCRAEYAQVIEGEGFSLTNQYEKVLYKKGEIVRPDKFDPNPLVECSNGIHFFLTRQEAKEFNM